MSSSASLFATRLRRAIFRSVPEILVVSRGSPTRKSYIRKATEHFFMSNMDQKEKDAQWAKIIGVLDASRRHMLKIEQKGRTYIYDEAKKDLVLM